MLVLGKTHYAKKMGRKRKHVNKLTLKHTGDDKLDLFSGSSVKKEEEVTSHYTISIILQVRSGTAVRYRKILEWMRVYNVVYLCRKKCIIRVNRQNSWVVT